MQKADGAGETRAKTGADQVIKGNESAQDNGVETNA